MRVCVIPARGASKRVPRKNVRPFHGQPMIAWSIEAAKASGAFDSILVSTDDEEIADVSRALGAQVPFVRSAELSGDHAGTVPVVADALRRWEREHAPCEFACCLYATAPFVEADDLVRALEMLESSKADYVVPVTTFPFPVQRGVKLIENGRMQMFHPEHVATRSQDLEEAYHDVGQFYWGTREAWLDERALIGPASAAFVVPRHRAQDIDTPEDWHLAELLFAALRAQETA